VGRIILKVHFSKNLSKMGWLREDVHSSSGCAFSFYITNTLAVAVWKHLYSRLLAQRCLIASELSQVEDQSEPKTERRRVKIGRGELLWAPPF
jgi:hypothetical protein